MKNKNIEDFIEEIKNANAEQVVKKFKEKIDEFDEFDAHILMNFKWEGDGISLEARQIVCKELDNTELKMYMYRIAIKSFFEKLFEEAKEIPLEDQLNIVTSFITQSIDEIVNKGADKQQILEYVERFIKLNKLPTTNMN